LSALLTPHEAGLVHLTVSNDRVEQIMNWIERYHSRIVTADQAVRQIKSGDRLFLTGNCSVPQKLLGALTAYAPELKDVEICQALTVGPADYVRPGMESHLRVNTMFISSNIRPAVWEGRADFTPVLLSEFPLLFKRGILPIDVAGPYFTARRARFLQPGIEVGLTKSVAEWPRSSSLVNQQCRASWGTLSMSAN
jgi:acetyl-CoA hydrolase